MTATDEMPATLVPAAPNAQRPLPDGWRWVRLGDVCKVVTGGTPPKSDERYYGGDIPWIKPDDLDRSMYVSSSTERLSDLGGRVSRLLPAGSVLVSCIGKLGKVAIAGRTLATNQQINSLIPLNVADSVYLFYACKYIRPQIEEAAAVTIVPIVNKSSFSGLQIPLPPLSEQRRIAAILTEQMAAVERARAAAQAQLEAARMLPAAYLRAVFDSAEAQGWPTRRLGDVLQLRKDVVYPRENPKGPATFVGLEHITSATGIRTGSLDVEMSQLTGRKPRFYRGDIVYGYLRPYLNKLWIAEFDGLCSVDQYVYAVRSNVAATPFVAWFMRSPVYLSRAPINTTPGQLPRIRTEEVASVEINLPSLEKQQRIAMMLDERMAEAEQARTALEAQLDAIDRLPGALLRRAFSGEL